MKRDPSVRRFSPTPSSGPLSSKGSFVTMSGHRDGVGEGESPLWILYPPSSSSFSPLFFFHVGRPWRMYGVSEGIRHSTRGTEREEMEEKNIVRWRKEEVTGKKQRCIKKRRWLCRYVLCVEFFWR